MTYQEATFSVPCRHRGCHAQKGQRCFAKISRRQSSYFHDVRKRDAYKVLSDLAKLEGWNQRYKRTEVSA